MPDPFANLPAISLCNTDVAALQISVVQAFQDMWLADTGETLVLTQADRRYHFLLSLTVGEVDAGDVRTQCLPNSRASRM